MGLPHSHRISRARWYSGFLPLRFSFNYRAVTLFCCAFQHSSSTSTDTLVSPNPTHISICGLGSYPFARHYLGNRCFTFFSSRYLDVSVPWVPLITLCIHVMILYWVRSRIRISTDQCLFATPRSFSQLITSFFGAWCQGIHHTLLLAWSFILVTTLYSYG